MPYKPPKVDKAIVATCKWSSCTVPVTTYPGQPLQKWCGKHRRIRAERLKRLKQLGGREGAVLRSARGTPEDIHALPL